jgi:competence protein ComEC
MPLSDPLSSFLFLAAAHTAGCLLDLLSVMSRWPVASFNLVQPATWLVLLASLGALLLMFPRGLPGRWLGLALVLPLFAQARSPDPGAIRVDILDVGQGTAVLLSTASHLLLYDSGPGDGERFNLVNQVIEPAILHSGHDMPDRIIISHADLDHAGGLSALQLRYPFSQISAKLPETRPGLDSCDNGLKWNWDDISFEVLHPGPFLPYLGNDSSCVLSVRTAHVSILLPGDISTAVEQRLLQSGLLPHDVLLVPHHGSNSSSSIAFLQRLKPKAAVATAGAGNRFDFPRPEVTRRFKNLDIDFWSTNACGAVRFDFSGDGSMTASSARQTRAAPWRWPAEAGCP